MMAIWGIITGDGKSCKIDEERLTPLGLTCWGGGDKNGKTTYHVFNKDKTFDVYLIEKDFKNVDKIYNKFLRTEKLKKLNESNS